MSPLELEDRHDLTLVREVAIAPAGERAAFLAEESDPAADERRTALYTVPLDDADDAGDAAPHRLTRASAGSDPRFSPDGSRLAFLAARERDDALDAGRAEGEGEAEGGDERDGEDGPRTQVWAFDLDRGGDARQLTNLDRGVREFDWSPDGDRLVVSARDPTDEQREYVERVEDGGPIEVTRLQHKRDGAGWLDDVTTYLFVVDVVEDEGRVGEAERLDEAFGAGSHEPLSGLQPAWGTGNRIAFLSNRTERPDDSAALDVYTIDPDGSALGRVTDGDVYATTPTWSPDGTKLAFGARTPPMNWYRPAELFVADRTRDEFGSVTADLDRTVVAMAGLNWLDDDRLVTLVGDEGRTRLIRCHAGGAPAERVFDDQGTGRSLDGLAAAPGTDRAAVVMSSPDETPAVYALSDLESPTRRTDLNADFEAEHALPDCERVRFENGDGESIEALAFLPPTLDPDDPVEHPLVAWIHGGPMGWDAPDFGFDRSFFTGQGYVVLCVNYRGSASYGRAFCESLRGSRGDLETDDVLCGVDHLVERGWADPDRLFCTGLSYGGITSAHIAVRDNRFAAIAPEHGIYDYASNFGTDDNHLWHEDEFGLPWEAPGTYRDISSIDRVDEIDTPLLVTAGEEDWRCPPTQAEQLYVSVRKRGVDAKLVVYQDEHHGVSTPERAVHRLRELHDWFERHDPTTAEGEGPSDD
jgi:dipeptidyl aminopeptidase/acylaminoacyl peptidase